MDEDGEANASQVDTVSSFWCGDSQLRARLTTFSDLAKICLS